MDTFLTWFWRLWVGLVILANIAGIVGTALTSDSFWTFLDWLQQTYSPFNIWNWGLNIVLLMPAFGAYWWKEKRKKSSATS